MMTDRNVLVRRRVQAETQRKALLESLDRQQIEQRIRSLAADGLSDYDVAETLGLHREQVRRVLSERQA